MRYFKFAREFFFHFSPHFDYEEKRKSETLSVFLIYNMDGRCI